MELSMTWEPAYNLAPFSFLCCSYLMCTEKRLLFSSSFFLESLILHPSKGAHLLFFFYFRSGDSHPDVEQKIQKDNQEAMGIV